MIAPVELFSDKFIVAAGVLALDVNTLVVSEYVTAPSGSVAATVNPLTATFLTWLLPICPAAVVHDGAEPAVTSTSGAATASPPSGLVTLIE